MRRSLSFLLTASALFVLAPHVADAAPLSLTQLNEFNLWVQCTEACGELPPSPTFEQQRVYFSCVSDCGNARRVWEKNGVAPINRDDLDLAILEAQGAATEDDTLICYKGENDEVVSFGALCTEQTCQEQPICTVEQCELPEEVQFDCTDDEEGGTRCWWPDERRPPSCPDVVCEASPQRTAEQCADQDGDDIPAWLEEQQGSTDLQADPLCGGLRACAFDEVCTFNENLGRGQCAPRACDGPCTLFHMEVVSQDDQNSIVWVYLDHTALPARVLDLYIDYDRNALSLEDARPLPALSMFGKDLRSSHLSNGLLRLSVFDTGNTDPIQSGPIIELIFRRTAETSGQIAFTDNPELRREAIAPVQGEQQDTLTEDTWWGEPITLGDRSTLDTKLALWYGFESKNTPIQYANIASAEDLCSNIADCANEPDPTIKARTIALLERLQRGSIQSTDTVEGVTANGLYFNGERDHVRMPVAVQEPYTPGDQSFTFSTWFYSEGNTDNELRDTPQVLWTHNGFDERTRLGLMLRESEDEGMNLVFFDGDLLSKTPPPSETPIALNIPLRSWHHVAFSLNARTGETIFYYDGEEVTRTTLEQPPAAIACPQMNAGTELRLHREGDILGGSPSEFLYMGVSQNGLFKVIRMDLRGTDETEILGDGQYSYRDPDYSPILDKIVYASNASGNFEIWIANGDGTGRQRITEGFGDASRGITARRPRWAPDGSAIVFESNIFDVIAGDNSTKRITHLYYIGYDPNTNLVSIETPGGGTTNQLNYPQNILTQSINLYRLTHSNQVRNHTKAQWLTGRTEDNRGVLLFESNSERFDANQVERLTINNNIPSTQFEPVSNLGDPSYDFSLLTAHRSVRPAFPEPIETRTLFYKRTFATYDAEDQFTLSEGDDNGDTIITVAHNPNGYDPLCWDANTDNVRNSEEDTNGDNVWDINDCYPHDVRNLYVEYDANIFRPVLTDNDGNAITAGPLLDTVPNGGVHKDLAYKSIFPNGRAMVRVEVLSPYNSLPIPAGVLAEVRFERIDNAEPAVDFAPIQRNARDELLTKNLLTIDPPTLFQPAGVFEELQDAIFSPDGDTLLLNAISNARPILLRTEGLTTAAGSERLSRTAMRTRGISWARQDSLYPCNWIGGYLHPFDKLVVSSMRGGLDDLKFFHGLRNAESIRSEAERGIERLQRNGNEEADSRLPECGNSNAECPPYHLCVESECVMVDCDPNDPYSCNEVGGSCVRRPLSVEQENANLDPEAGFFDFVCATDCVTDQQCFTQECLNGPCRFCQEETCIECQFTETDFGAFSIAGIEGCPDRNSFACVAGACITECYAFEDGQSRYLCDPATEYCYQGRCVLLDWDWPDLSPGTFVGLSDARYDLPTNVWEGYTAAVGERFIVQIDAYGVSDYTHAPEVVVEVKGGPVYGSSWNRIGRVKVHSVTRAEGSSKPITLETGYPFTDLRLRMITPPYHNVTAAANGLRDFDKDFCIQDIRQSAINAGEDPNAADLSPCYRRSPGSLENLGYRASIPMHEAIEACRKRGHAGCPSTARGEHDYFQSGSPAVIVTDIRVDGQGVMPQIAQNTVCTYEGNLSPIDNGIPKKLFYGDITTEQSNLTAKFCADNPDACANPTSVAEFDLGIYGFALLNCNVYDPVNPDTGSAQIEVRDLVITREFPASNGAITFDNGDLCRVEIDALRSQPCYEWDASAVLDPNADATESFATLDFGLGRSFGHDQGYTSVPLPSYPLNITLFGYTGEGLVLSNGADLLTVTTQSEELQTLTFSQEVLKGYNYHVKVAEQPTTPNMLCHVDPDSERGRMPNGPASVRVNCEQRYTLGGVASGLAVDTSAALTVTSPHGSESLRVANDGPFTFPTALSANTEWSVEVTQQPRGQRCTLNTPQGQQPEANDTSLVLTCEDLPLFDFEVVVSGLRGELVLIERTTGQELTVLSNGPTTFPSQILAGTAYDLVIAQQPQDPAQVCNFLDPQQGTMPSQDFIANRITCTTLPTYSISVTHQGVEGQGLRITLNGEETIDVAPANIGELPVATFATRLAAGEPFEITIAQQPTSPEQSCQLLDAVGVMGGGDRQTTQLLCQSPPPNSDRYTISGEVFGLAENSRGLRIADTGSLRGENANGSNKLDITSNGSFTLNDPIFDGNEYNIVIDRQPFDPPQICRVAQGSGRVNGGNISDVRINCAEGATVSLNVELDADGAQVQAFLYTTQGERRRIARTLSTNIEGGEVSRLFVELDSEDAAILDPGEYEVALFVNVDGSVDPNTGEPTYTGTDLGSRSRVVLQPNEETPVRFFSGNLQRLAQIPVTGRADLNIPSESTLICLIAPNGTGQLTLPTGQDSPVFGTSVRACEAEEDCFVRRTVFDPFTESTTDDNAFVPPGQYDLTCFVDIDADGTINSGDYLGTLQTTATNTTRTVELSVVP